MIGYICLLLALLGGLIKGFAGKKVSRDVISLKDGLFVNTVRTVFCTLFGFAAAVFQAETSAFALSYAGVAVCLASAVFTALFGISWLYAYKTEAYTFLSVFTMLGAVVTGLLGWIVYREPLSMPRVIGMVLLLIAVYILSLYNTNLTGKITPKAAATLLIGGMSVALADFMQKVFVKEAFGSAYIFSFYTYFLALVPQTLLWFAVRKCGKTSRNPVLSDTRHVLIFGVMAFCLYLGSISKTVAVGYLPATQMYPMLQGANLICSAVLAQILLKEKITTKSVFGIGIAIAAVVLMNF